MAGPTRTTRPRPSTSTAPTQPPRPPNSWIIYLSDTFKQMKDEGYQGSWTAAVKLISPTWRALSAAEKEPYVARAAQAKLDHGKMYAGYKFQPGLRKAQKVQASRLKKGLGMTECGEDYSVSIGRKRTSLAQINLDHLFPTASSSSKTSWSSSVNSYGWSHQAMIPFPSDGSFELSQPMASDYTPPTLPHALYSFTNAFDPVAQVATIASPLDLGHLEMPTYSHDDRGSYDQRYWGGGGGAEPSLLRPPAPVRLSIGTIDWTEWLHGPTNGV